MKSFRPLARMAGASLALATAVASPSAAAGAKHVLLISIDGMHASDLTNYVASHPKGTLASLSKAGVTYPNAYASRPSDSFPGLLAMLTGGSSKSHGVFYDVSYDRTLFAPGSKCAGAPGTQPAFDESIDKDSSKVTGGGILGRTLTQIDVTKLPLALRNGQCKPVFPHEFVKVNTIFEVAHQAGLRTAWADKHPAYDIVNGPSGEGVSDLFTPEVNSNDSVTGQDTTKGFHSIQRNDLVKVTAILNEIAGLNSTGKTFVGVPAIFGMNFQAVSVGQKLAVGSTSDPQDAGLIGGYADPNGVYPNNGLAANLDFVDQQLGEMVTALGKAGLRGDTLLIVSAKHGQSPINIKVRQAFDDGPYQTTPGYAASITDDVGLVWLTPALQQSKYAAAKAYLEKQSGKLGIVRLLDRTELSKLYRDPFSDNRTPDFVAITKHGLIYTSGTKLAEHGGFSPDDRNVALLVANPSIAGHTNNFEVDTRQIAPTILRYLALDPKRLAAVTAENTDPLPSVGTN